jgi:hypothetical protein
MVTSQLFATGHIAGGETWEWYVWGLPEGETHIFTAYPMAGVQGVPLRIDNLRIDRVPGAVPWQWRITFDLTDLQAAGKNLIAYSIYWTRISWIGGCVMRAIVLKKGARTIGAAVINPALGVSVSIKPRKGGVAKEIDISVSDFSDKEALAAQLQKLAPVAEGKTKNKPTPKAKKR